jgi:hypothetical protein
LIIVDENESDMELFCDNVPMEEDIMEEAEPDTPRRARIREKLKKW